ncbi:rhodanese-like domain-containing protein [Nocardioides sediminis]|uniref:rhodanese-like domain-containing protein n=1 Tax=Nocardioides sediminis TaxID=433648 RepID=UPI000D3107B6|nr:rhodanese-like domain-containing protein [Nocardioides sediminis]
MQVVVVEVPERGNRAHLVHDGASALVVDPPRDWRPLELAAEEAGVRIVAVADTHVHNDYVSGAPGLARRHGADYWLSADERVTVDRTGVRGGDILGVGDLVVQVLSTPGHTLHHQSFLVTDPESGARSVLSGGSLLHGTVGRTDLVDPLLSRMMGRAQWESARQLGALDDEVALHPTHGFGSLCAATSATDAVHGTVGDERAVNPVLWTPRDAWVEALVAGFGPVPRYYRHMSALNRAGAGATPVLAPAEIDEDEVHAAVRAGSWVLDLRRRHAFARAHLTGSVNIEDCPQLATYAGWLVPWGADVVLVSVSPDDLAAGVHDLAQIGIAVRATHLLGPVGTWADSTDYRVADWATYSRVARQPHPRSVTLDVRLDAEYHASHLPDSLHVPLHDLEAAIPRLPAGQVWVHCRSGFRAAIAASLLARRGRDVVLVTDDWEQIASTGLATVAGRPAA